MAVQPAGTASTEENSSKIAIDYAPVGISAEPRPVFGDVLTLGFGITVAAWTCAYICRMPIVNADGPTTVVTMLGVIILGGMAAGRYSHKGWRAGIYAGGISGILDILIVGSLIQDYTRSHHGATLPSAALWIGGSIGFNAAVAGLGAALGSLIPSPRRTQIAWAQVFAIVLCCATLPLITAGGLVTAFRVGMAVPDWPQSYGYNMFLFPLSMMQKHEGNFYEHAHRLMGSLVGFTALTLAIYLTCVESRRWVKIYAWSLGVAIAIQAVLGGTRVTENSIPLAIAHGIFAQVVFAGMAALAAITSRRFIALQTPVRDGASVDWVLAITFLSIMVVQLLLGALVRHKDMLVLLHITVAMFVAMIGMGCGVRAWGMQENFSSLRRAGAWLMTIIGLQLFLGIQALIFRNPHGETPTTVHAFMTTAHQANGALLLATGAVLAAWTFRGLEFSRTERLTTTAS